jgi:radical SAM superfamily enzyme YgiQ (UPF0313 family)
MAKQKVILFHPRTLHERNYRNFWIPYSVLSIGSHLTSKGYDITIVDNNFEQRSPEEIVTELTKPDLVGVSTMIGHQISEGLNFAAKVKEKFPGVKTIFGGGAPTILPEQFLGSDYVDIIVRGQGEQTVLETAEALKEKKSLENIPGISFKDNNGTPIHNSPRTPVSRDAFAAYNYSLVDPASYIRSDEHISNRVLNHISSQGCPFGCGFCSEVALYDRKWASESLERMMQEVSELVEQHGADGIKFYDANFFVNKKRALSFAEEVKKRGWNIQWAASAHPKNLLVLNDDELRTVSNSGCSRVLIGAESGNNEELNYINKNMTTEEVLEVAKRLGRVGIHGSFTVIVGYPGFPEDNIARTLDFGRKIASISELHEVKAHVYAPYPGTPLYKDAIKHGFVAPKTLEDWANYDYYEVQTPWLRQEVTPQIRDFNLNHCPYVL